MAQWNKNTVPECKDKTCSDEVLVTVEKYCRGTYRRDPKAVYIPYHCTLEDMGYGCISDDTGTTIISHNRLIPKKPTKDKYVPELDFCPECGTEVTNCNYCPHCGQLIDWNK